MATTRGFIQPTGSATPYPNDPAKRAAATGGNFNSSMYANYPGATRASVFQNAVSPSQIAKAIGMSPQAAAQLSAAVNDAAAARAGALSASAGSGTGYMPSAAAQASGTAPTVAPTSPYQQGGQVMNGGNFTTASVPSASVNNPASPLPQNDTDPVDWNFNGTQGASQSFSQRDLENMLNDPYRFQRNFLSSVGMNTPGANAALGQYASRLNPLAFVLAGQNMSPEGQSDLEDLANVYEGLMSNYITPGGRMPDVREIMNTLLGQDTMGNDDVSSNLLQSVIAGQDPEGQVQAVNQILGASLAGMPGLFGQGWSNMLDQAGAAYGDATQDGQQGIDYTYLNYLNSQPFWQQLAGR